MFPKNASITFWVFDHNLPGLRGFSREDYGMTSNEILGTLKGILYTTSLYRHFTTTGWIERLIPVKKRPAWPPGKEIIPELFEKLQNCSLCH
jgi:hypothetical protein